MYDDALEAYNFSHECCQVLSFPSLRVEAGNEARPSPSSSFDCLQQYAKTEGEGLVDFNDRQREGSLTERTYLMHTFFVLNKEQYAYALQTLETPVLEQKLQEKASS